MNNSDYRINVDANVRSAEEKLARIRREFEQLQKMSEKGVSGDHVMSGADYDKSIKLVRDLTKNLRELDATYSDLSKHSDLKDSAGAMKVLYNEINRTKEQLNSLDQIANNINGTMSKMGHIDKTYINEQKLMNNELSDNLKILTNIKRTEQDIKNARARVGRTVTRATDTGRMDYNNTRRLRGEVGRGQEYEQLRKNNIDRMAYLRDQRASVGNRIANTAEQLQKGAINDNEYRNRIASLKQERSEIEKEIKARQSLNHTIKETEKTLKMGASTLNDKSIRQEADPKSIKGIMQSRSFAISMSALGAGIGAMAGMYAKGSGIEKSIRGDAIQIGQQTGVSDYRGYKRSIAELGMQKDTGYTPEMMLGFTRSVLSGQGNLGQEETLASTEALAKGTRGLAVNSGDLSQFVQSSMQNGAVSGSSQITALTKSLAGAIKVGGMSGRDDEVLKALQQIADNTFAGKNVSSSQMDSMIAMNTMLNETGNKSVQGAQGAQLQSDISSSLRGLDLNSSVATWFGQGTRFQGQAGQYDLRKKLENGLDGDNLSDLMRVSSTYGPGVGSKGQKAALISAFGAMGTNVTTDQADALVDVYQKYKGDPDKLNEKVKEIKDKGDKESKKNQEGYSDSAEGAKNLAEAVVAVKALETADNKLITTIDKMIGSLDKVNATIFTIGSGLIASTTMLGGSLLSSVGSSIFKGGFKGKGGGGSGGLGSFISGASDTLKGTKAGQAVAKGSGKAGNFASDALKGFESTITKNGPRTIDGTTGIGNFMRGAVDGAKDTLGGLKGSGAMSATAEAASGGGGWFKSLTGGLGKGLGKVAIPLGVASSLFNVATAEDKTKAVGSEVGGWSGGLAGASVGASWGAGLGSIVPGLGTAVGAGVGGVAGGLIGAFGGSKLGEGVVDAGRSAWKGIKGLFGGGDVSADEISSSPGDTATQSKNSSNSQKRTAEQIRANNNQIESSNLKKYEELLTKAQQILAQAKAQNGIYGNGNGSGSSNVSGGGSTVSGKGSLKLLEKGKTFTTGDAKTHDLGYTTDSISAEGIDNWIKSVSPNSPMVGMGSTFIKAGEESGLDPRYLVAHAALESGWGTSSLSKNGDAETGNWFGIGAFDSNPANGENYGLGIVGGAKWIADNYYKQGQTTVDSMRHNNGVHEYATDPEWANKIGSTMDSLAKATGPSTGTSVTNNITVNANGTKENADTIANKVANATANKTKSTLNYYTREVSRI